MLHLAALAKRLDPAERGPGLEAFSMRFAEHESSRLNDQNEKLCAQEGTS